WEPRRPRHRRGRSSRRRVADARDRVLPRVPPDRLGPRLRHRGGARARELRGRPRADLVGAVRPAHAGSGARLPGGEFILTARALGQRRWRILLFHLLPNCLSPILVKATIDVSLAILLLAALSFLGVGAQPPLPEWGAMVTIGRKYLLDYPWYATFPGLAIFITVLAFNVLGERVRDVLDPQSRAGARP